MSSTYGTPDIPPGELAEPGEVEPMIDPTTGKKISRPRNAWILYRNSRLEDVQRMDDGSRQPMADASKIISSWWKAESQDVRLHFEMMAEKEKEEHKRRFPNYRFQPKSKQQKAREKAAKREAAKKVQATNKKAKTRQPSPPQPYVTSTHTSYLAAAMANQGQPATTPHSAFSAEGPSPPLSLASTPTTTPSPFASSDFEQGSSTSATSAHTLPSPSDALGLGLPSPLNFSSQDEANARVPRRTPARLPPRPRGPKVKSESSISSRVTSSSSATARALSPALVTPSALSPLPWPLPSGDAQHGLSPQSRDVSPPSAPNPVADPTEQWFDSGLYEGVQNTTSVELDFAIPNSFSDEFFSNLGDGLLGEDSTGVFTLPLDPFAEQPPDQFDISLAPSSSVGNELEIKWNDFMNTFDISSLPNAVADGSAPAMEPIPEANETEDWQKWVGATDNAQLEGPSSALIRPSHELPPFNTCDVDDPMTQGPTPPAEYYSNEPHPQDLTQSQQQQHLEQQPPQHHQPQPMPPSIADLPPRLAGDPNFLMFYNQYLAHVQQQKPDTGSEPQPAPPPQPQHMQQHFAPYSSPQDPQPLYHQSQSQYHADAYSQPAEAYSQPTETYSQPGSRHTSYSGQPPYTPASAHPSPGPSHTTSEQSTSGGRYTPPSGAAVTVGLRRVGGTWRPPIRHLQSEPGSRIPSWGSVASN